MVHYSWLVSYAVGIVIIIIIYSLSYSKLKAENKVLTWQVEEVTNAKDCYYKLVKSIREELYKEKQKISELTTKHENFKDAIRMLLDPDSKSDLFDN